MGVQVAGLMIITLAIMVLTLMSQVAVTSELETTSAATQTIDSTGERARTNMEFVDSSAAVGELTVELKNTGFTTIFDFSQMDFIVEYLDSLDNDVITSLTYITGALGNTSGLRPNTSISPTLKPSLPYQTIPIPTNTIQFQYLPLTIIHKNSNFSNNYPKKLYT